MPSFPDGVGLTIAVPLVGRPVVPEWAFCVANLHPPMNYNVRWAIIKYQPVDMARNNLIEMARKENSKYIFFLGDDVTVPPETIRQLLFNMEHNPKMAVCGAVYCHKSHPNAPMVFRGNGIGPYWDWKVGELFQISGIGMDATMIRMSALDSLKKPYFRTVDSIQDMMEGVNRAESWTEDLYFCKKITDAGWEVWADGSLICTHWDATQIPGKGYSLPANSKPMMRAGVVYGDKKIVDLGCGPIENSFKSPEGQVLRVDIREEVNPDYRCDIRKLPFATGEFDVVFSSHTLEHFPLKEVPSVVEEWIRVMKPDGELRLMLPNLEWAAQQIVNGECDMDCMNVLYGAQTYDENYHKMGFTPKIVEQMLTNYGFRWYIWDFHKYHMLVRAWRERPAEWPEGATPQEAQVVVNPVIKLKRDDLTPNVTIKIDDKTKPEEICEELDSAPYVCQQCGGVANSKDPQHQTLCNCPVKTTPPCAPHYDAYRELKNVGAIALTKEVDEKFMAGSVNDVERKEEPQMVEVRNESQPPKRTPNAEELLFGKGVALK